MAWNAIPQHFTRKSIKACNIFISCVDNIKSRLDIADILSEKTIKYYDDESKPMYWIDYGNTQKSGQVILGTLEKIEQPKSRKYITVAELPTVTERFDLTKIKDNDSGPSCSHEQALAKQDLFINTSLATLGSHLLWELLRDGRTDKAGLYLNLENIRANSIFV